MKLTFRVKRFLVFAVASFFAGAVDCAALGARQNQEAHIQAIIEQWTSIEHSLIYAQFLDNKNIEGGGGGVIQIFVLINSTRLKTHLRLF